MISTGTRKRIEVRDRVIGDGRLPLICTPLVGKTSDAVLSELNEVLAKRPDLIEWRADYFGDLDRHDAVIDLAGRIKSAAGDTPLIYTIRSSREGGEKIALTDDQVVELHAAICRSGHVDIVDYELSNPSDRVGKVRTAVRQSGAKLILSYHNFRDTPPLDLLSEKFSQAERFGADIAKVAVMPTTVRDVLTLLAATLTASESLNIPVISMSMTGLGSLSRMFGWVFGSAVTFAVGAGGSAPGQLPIEDLRTVLEITHRAHTGK
jgi:3-dehydroquinate dehydratase-1